MTSLWPSEFTVDAVRSVKEILDDQSKILLTLTKGVVNGEVVEMEPLQAYDLKIGDDFGYHFHLIAKYMKNYRFRVFSFSHSIALYPVRFRIDDVILAELKLPPILKFESAEEVEPFLQNVFNSKRMKTIVSGIMRLSKS